MAQTRNVVEVATRDGTILQVEQHGSDAAHEAVILCHGLIQNSRAFTVPSFSVGAFLAARGFCVYALNLRGREGNSAHHDFGTYVDEDAVAIIDLVAARHPSVSWIGHSMGGLIGVAVRKPLQAVVAVGSPLMPGDARLRQLSIDRGLFKMSRMLASKGRPFPGRDYARLFSRLRSLIDKGWPWPLPLWKPGSFDDHDLCFALKNSFAADGHHVLADLCQLAVTNGTQAGRVGLSERLRALRTPLMCVAGSADGIAPADSVHALFSRAASPVKRYLEVDAGHIDLITGRNAAAQVWEPIMAFVREQRRVSSSIST